MNKLSELKNCLYYISFPLSFTGFILPVYALDVGASAVEVGILYSIFFLVSILMRPKVGIFIDKRGRKLGLFIGILLYCLTNFLLLFSRNFKCIFLSRIFQSIGASFLWISVDAMISDISNNQNRSQNFGIVSQSVCRGDFIGGIIGFGIFFSDFFDEPFRVIFTIYLIFALIALYTCIFKVKETLSLKSTYSLKKSKVYRDKKKIVKFMLLTGFIFYVFNLVFPLYIIYLKDYIVDNPYLIGLVFLPGEVFSLFLPKKFGILADRYDRRKILIIGIFILGIIQFFIPFIDSFSIFIIVYSIISLILLFMDPAASGLVIDYIGYEKRGEGYGLYSFAGGLGGIFGPLVGTYYYEYIGGKSIFIIDGFLLIFICIIMNAILKNKLKINSRL